MKDVNSRRGVTTTIQGMAAVGAAASAFAGLPALAAGPSGTYVETTQDKNCTLNASHFCSLAMAALPSTNALRVEAASCQMAMYFGTWFTPPPAFEYVSISDSNSNNQIFMDITYETSWPDGSNSSGQETGTWYFRANMSGGSILYINAGQKPLFRFNLGPSYASFTSADIACTVEGALINP